MNILLISNDRQILIEGSAVRERMCAYATELAKDGGTLHILLRTNSTVEIKDGSLIIHGVAAHKLRILSYLPGRAKEVIVQYRIGVVSAQDPFEYGYVAARAVRGTSAKLHIQVHTDFLSPWFTQVQPYTLRNVYASLLNQIRIRIADYVLPKASGIRVVSERIQASLIKKFGTRISVPTIIPIAVSTDVSEAVPLPPHSFTFALLSVGRLEPEKRIEDCIAAIDSIKIQHPSVGLFIANEGRERQKLERMVARLGLQDRVVFLGSRADIRGLMRSAQVFIQTSAYEGYGLALVEAALAGVPIITSDVGIVGEVFTANEHVLVGPVGDSRTFSKHILQLIEKEDMRRALVENAQNQIYKYLSSIDTSPQAVISDISRLG